MRELTYFVLQNEEEGEGIDAHAVKQAVAVAIKNWSESTEQD